MQEKRKGLAGWLLIGLLVLLLSSVTSFFMGFGSGYGVQQYCAGLTDLQPATDVSTGNSSQLSAEQNKISQMVVSVGLNRGRSLRDIKVALMTAKQESGMRNISYGDRDSLGIYQQRAGWGSTKQRLDPVYAINKFYAALERVKNRADMALMEVAIAVQRPSRAAYTSPSNNFNSWAAMADAILKGVAPKNAANGSSSMEPMTYDDACETTSSSTDTSSSQTQGGTGGEASQPLPTMRIGSPYGQRFHPILRYWRLHDGIDLSARSGTPIRSIGNGKIVFRGYNSGAGNHVRVSYGDGNVASYLHMSRFASKRAGDQVAAGEVIGYVGSTGLSTAPHLHLGWKVNGKSANPVPQLCSRGIKIAGPKGCSKYNSN